MLGGMRGHGGGEKENQGNDSGKVKGDAGFHKRQLRQRVTGRQDYLAYFLLGRNQYIAPRGDCTYNVRAPHSHESGGVVCGKVTSEGNQLDSGSDGPACSARAFGGGHAATTTTASTTTAMMWNMIRGFSMAGLLCAISEAGEELG